MTKPTEGPYYWTDGENPIDINTYASQGYYDNPQLLGKDGRDVIGCDEYWIIGPFGNDDEMRTNARLLAASWEMREMLGRVVESATAYDAYSPLRRDISALLARIDGDTE